MRIVAFVACVLLAINYDAALDVTNRIVLNWRRGGLGSMLKKKNPAYLVLLKSWHTS
jgi:hypothetical protein